MSLKFFDVFFCFCAGQPGIPGEKGNPGLPGSVGESGLDGRAGTELMTLHSNELSFTMADCTTMSNCEYTGYQYGPLVDSFSLIIAFGEAKVNISRN